MVRESSATSSVFASTLGHSNATVDDPSFHRDGPLPRLGSGHQGGFHVLFTDGSTQFLESAILLQVLKSLLTRDGGEAIGA